MAIALGPFFNIWFAISTHLFINSFCGVTWFTKPIDFASFAFIIRPVTIISLAIPAPTNRGNLWVPPQPGKRPKRTSGWPNVALSLATRIWHAILISHPPPRANPFTAAIIGFCEFSMYRVICWPALPNANALSGSIVCIFFISAPATNALSPDPVKIMTPTLSSSIQDSTAPSKSNSNLIIYFFFNKWHNFTLLLFPKCSAK